MADMKDCPKCNGRMAPGFVLDHSDDSRTVVSTWQGGEPQRSIWTGLKQDKAQQHPITSYRCARCGYLESYAPADARARPDTPR